MRGLALCLLVTLAGSSVAAPVPKSLKARNDKALIVGTWKLTKDGNSWFQFNDDGTMRRWDEQGGTSTDGTYTFDLNANPKILTIKLSSGAVRGIECQYEIDRDEFKIGYLRLWFGGANPPEKIPGAGQYHIRLIRDTSAK